MCHGAALGVGIRVVGLRPGTDPVVCIGVTCLQEESLERRAADGHWKNIRFTGELNLQGQFDDIVRECGLPRNTKEGSKHRKDDRRM